MFNLTKIATLGVGHEDMNSRGISVILLFILDMIFLAACILAYHFNFPPDIKTVLTTCFVGWNGALALALNSKSTPFPVLPPTIPPATSDTSSITETTNKSTYK